MSAEGRPGLGGAVALLPLAIVVVVAAALIATSPAPAPAMDDPIARAVPVGPLASDLPDGDVEGEDPPEGPRSPNGQACLERIVRGTGYADLCWSVARDPNDADPAKDYYLLRVYGTHEGLRFLAVRSDLVGTPGDGVISLWPTGTIEGSCETREVHLTGYSGALPAMHVCGHTIGELDAGTWAHTVTWTCQGCARGSDVARGFDMVSWVAVPARAIPVWDVFADGAA